MARYNGVFAEPREVLRAVPTLELREMDRRERSTFCCGAGGGRMWMEETTGTRINEERARQAVATGADTVVTECPFCLTMVRDGLAAAEAGGSDMRTADLAEILAESLVAAPAPVDAWARRPAPIH
jgi:Fe-S oxidoreductase